MKLSRNNLCRLPVHILWDNFLLWDDFLKTQDSSTMSSIILWLLVSLKLRRYGRIKMCILLHSYWHRPSSFNYGS